MIIHSIKVLKSSGIGPTGYLRPYYLPSSYSNIDDTLSVGSGSGYKAVEVPFIPSYSIKKDYGRSIGVDILNENVIHSKRSLVGRESACVYLRVDD